MPRLELLIVENDVITVDALKHRFAQVFSDSIIIWDASTIESGQEIVKSRRERLCGAILDFHLPSELRRTLEIDESLCREIRLNAARATVFHYTGFSDDERVIHHYQNCHTGNEFHLYNKVLPAHAEKLREDVAGTLFSNRAKEILFALTGPPDALFVKHRPTAGPVTRRCAFLSALELGAIIERGWKYLGAEVKTQIQSSLCLAEGPSGARVSLTDTDSLQNELTGEMKAGRFDIRWHPGSFFSDDAVDRELITTYYASLASISQSKPGDERIHVFVHHIGGIFPQHDESFTDFDLEHRPYVVLPVWKPGSFGGPEARSAARFALREGSRAIFLANFRGKRPPLSWWWWIDAIAELDRTFATAGVAEEMLSFRDRADRSIDQPGQLLEAALFLEFLKFSQQQWYPTLFNDVLALAPQFSSPWEATEAVIGESFGDGVDLFKDFARHVYFLGDPMSYLIHRVGVDPLPKYRWNLDNATQADVMGQLDHLGRMYCQFESRSTSGSFEVRVSSENPSAKRWLRIELCPQDDEGRCTRRYLVQAESTSEDRAKVVWGHQSISFDSETAEDGNMILKRWILIISNCGFDERADGLNFVVTPTVSHIHTTAA